MVGRQHLKMVQTRLYRKKFGKLWFRRQYTCYLITYAVLEIPSE